MRNIRSEQLLTEQPPARTVVQLEVGIEKLESLFAKGELCAADIRCLNCDSKKSIWNLCLKSCARRSATDTYRWGG